jgi:3'(2'), 5'-bisphosphate nucleotidase
MNFEATKTRFVPMRMLAEACELAQQAGREIMRFYRNGGTVAWKEDASPLTDADRASHDFLLKALGKLTPDVPVVSEESESSLNRTAGASRSYWLVDPLDGTKEFVKGTDEFTVNIALMKDDSPVLGVVHAPALQLTYYGGQGLGAWRHLADKRPASISVRCADPSRLGVVASKDHAGPMVKAMLSRLNEPRLQSMGSSLKFCLVAEGKADLYLRDLPTMEWDTAAAQCVVEGAGGGVYSLDGAPLRYGKPGLKNPAIMTMGDTAFDWRSLIDFEDRKSGNAEN